NLGCFCCGIAQTTAHNRCGFVGNVRGMLSQAEDGFGHSRLAAWRAETALAGEVVRGDLYVMAVFSAQCFVDQLEYMRLAQTDFADNKDLDNFAHLAHSTVALGQCSSGDRDPLA